MSTILETIAGQLDKRLAELEPLVEEYRQLVEAHTALQDSLPQSSNGGTKHAPQKLARTKTASVAKTRSSTGTGKRGRPAGSGKRGAEVVELVKANPGITVSGIAGMLKIRPNYLYRVMPVLEKDGKVIKDGGAYSVPATE